MVSLSLRGTTSFVRCWSIILLNSRGTFNFTEHDHALSVDGLLYYPSDSIAATATTNEGNLDVPNASARGVISSSKITEKMLREGSFNGAAVTEFLVDSRFPFAGKMRVMRYNIGKVAYNDTKQSFECDIVGLSERLGNAVGEIYSRTCRWNFGDSNCNILGGLAAWTRTGTVATVGVGQLAHRFTTGALSGGAVYAGLFNDGHIEWTNSNNDNLFGVIKRFTTIPSNTFELSTPPPTPILVGDTITVIAGCNKLSGVDIDGKDVPSGHCKHRYNNLLNFGGFPYIPTNDKLYQTPDAQRDS